MYGTTKGPALLRGSMNSMSTKSLVTTIFETCRDVYMLPLMPQQSQSSLNNMLGFGGGSSLFRSVFRLFLGMFMMEEVVLCASIHDCTSWISSSSPTSIFDFSKASSRLMMLLTLDSASTVEGAVMEVGGMSCLVGDSWSNSGLYSLRVSKDFPLSYWMAGLAVLRLGSASEKQLPISTVNKNNTSLIQSPSDQTSKLRSQNGVCV